MFLLYFDAFWGVVYGGLFDVVGVLLIVAAVGAGLGIANERRWGYGLGLAVALLPFVLRLANRVNPLAVDPIQLLFEIALVALLLHPQSREYQRIWFS